MKLVVTSKLFRLDPIPTHTELLHKLLVIMNDKKF
jgi:hypothetical protein